MLENWLRPINTEKFAALSLNKYQLGSRIKRFEEELPNVKKVKVAIIGIGEAAADSVREELYQLSCPFRRLKIADLGNVRKQDHSFIIPLIKELVDGKILPIIIGHSNFLTQAQYQAHQSFQKSLNMTIVDEKIHYHPRVEDDESLFLNPILDKADSDLFNLSVLGCQSHFVDDNVFDTLEKRHFECVRLGNAKANIPELEPIIRDADLLSFNLAALKRLEVPGVDSATPSGFFTEEAAQITRYAGMSDKLKSIGFYGVNPELDCDNASAKVTAQLIWYFLDGVFNRKSDFPVSTQGLTEYIVDFKSYHYQITFWNSSKSNRWWMQIPVKTDKNKRRHRLIPCSYADYLKACEEEMPERLLKAHRRFGN